jgi:hypothetical protein
MKTNANSTATTLEATDKAFERMMHKIFGRNETRGSKELEIPKFKQSQQLRPEGIAVLRLVDFHDCRFARQLKEQNSRHADSI